MDNIEQDITKLRLSIGGYMLNSDSIIGMAKSAAEELWHDHILNDQREQEIYVLSLEDEIKELEEIIEIKSLTITSSELQIMQHTKIWEAEHSITNCDGENIVEYDNPTKCLLHTDIYQSSISLMKAPSLDMHNKNIYTAFK